MTDTADADRAGADARGAVYEELAVALHWLDGLLAHAIASAQETYGTDATADPYRGLYIGLPEVDRLLGRTPAQPLFAEAARTIADHQTPQRLRELSDMFQLDTLAREVILIAAAPEIDLRYERLYAFLQDDVTRKRPTVDLVLNLTCATPAQKLAGRGHFGPDAPLLRNGLIRLIADANQTDPPLLAHYVKVDEQITGYLLGDVSMSPRLAPFCQIDSTISRLDDLPMTDEIRRPLRRLMDDARRGQQPLRLYIEGKAGSGRRRTAAALASETGAPLVQVDIDRLLTADVHFDDVLRLAFREAALRSGVLYMHGLEALDGGEHARARRALLAAIANARTTVIVAGSGAYLSDSLEAVGLIQIRLDTLPSARRRECWQVSLDAIGMATAADLETVASRFQLTPGQIAAAAATAAAAARWRREGEIGSEADQDEPTGRRPSGSSVTLDDLCFAARAHSGHALGQLAQKVEPVYTWNDIVLPADTLAQLREICGRVEYRDRVLDDWGFRRKLSLGRGSAALFAGPSGTGKTMAAEVIANELGLDLYRVDLAGVVSKYIGETEKNLERIFAAAENANAILFFDEADALFGKRSEVQDSHDRYANIETAYLLQKMEAYEGIAILATNFRANLDDAFVRRIGVTVVFHVPDEAQRLRIWQSAWPADTPRVTDLDFVALAGKFKLAGGHIKNIVLAAAYLAAEDGEPVGMGHIIRAIKREYQKLGKSVVEREFGELAHALQGTVQPLADGATMEHQPGRKSGPAAIRETTGNGDRHLAGRVAEGVS